MQKVFPDSQIVDEDDNPIGQMQLPLALKQGKILRVARVFVFNSSGELLLQQRGPKVFSPGVWCESASGHVDAGESYELTAQRELEEEIGLIGLELKEIMYEFIVEEGFNWAERRFNKVFKTKYDGPIKIQDSDEVAGFRWADLGSLIEEIRDHPAHFTSGFSQLIEIFCKRNKC